MLHASDDARVFAASAVCLFVQPSLSMYRDTKGKLSPNSCLSACHQLNASMCLTLTLGLQAKSQEVLGNKDYTETCWVASETDLIAGNKCTPPTEPLQPAQYKGLRRKNKCSGQGMGLKVSP